ncbi:unnamed protein product [Ectocarpus sp. 12 AP-2014]
MLCTAVLLSAPGCGRHCCCTHVKCSTHCGVPIGLLVRLTSASQYSRTQLRLACGDSAVPGERFLPALLINCSEMTESFTPPMCSTPAVAAWKQTAVSHDGNLHGANRVPPPEYIAYDLGISRRHQLADSLSCFKTLY